MSLSASAWPEKDGTVTNTNRQVQMGRAALPLPGETKPDWWITQEIGRRIGVTKNAVIGKVHRIGLTPRVITQKPPPRRNVFDFTGPACMWPIGHPGEDDFHFCGEHPMAGKPYCRHHVEVAYIKPKENQIAPDDKMEVPPFRPSVPDEISK